MRLATISLLALAIGTGCVSLHAQVPEEVVRIHAAREEGLDLAALCSHEGQSFSEGAAVCMAGQRMSCDASGRWAEDGEC